MRSIMDLKPEEVLRLAIAVEDRNEKVYREYASIFEQYEPKASDVFYEMAGEEHEHGELLRAFFQKKFGKLPPTEIFEEIKEPVEAPILPDAEVFIFDGMSPQRAFEVAKKTEILARDFYEKLAHTVKDPDLRGLYQELADIEKQHMESAESHEAAYFKIQDGEGKKK